MSEHSIHITVQQRTGAGWLVVAEQPAIGDRLPVRHQVVVTPEGGAVLFARLREVSARPLIYGYELGRAIFRGPVAEGWASAVGHADVLHVLLTPEAPEWQGLHWEWLGVRIDGHTDFVNLTQRTPTSFDVPSASDRRFPPIGRAALKALVVVASPTGAAAGSRPRYHLPEFDGPGTAAQIRAALQAANIPADVLAWDPVTRAPPDGAAGLPTLDTVLRTLTGGAYTLLHIACHGRQTSTGPVLYLVDSTNAVRPVAANEFLDGLRRAGKAGGLPRLAFLSVCESALEGAVPSLARRLVFELGMPAVVGMRGDVTRDTAVRLAASFYERLAAHGAVDRALAEARVGLFERPDVHLPFLYGRLGLRTLFTTGDDAPLTRPEWHLGLDRLRAVLDARAPVLRPAFDGPAAAAQAATDPAASDAVKREGARAAEELNRICGRVLGITFAGLARGPDSDTRPSVCPFRGLAPFGMQDSAFFFGREELTSELIRRLGVERFLAVLGRTGCGKSSVIFAGVVPAWQAANPGCRAVAFTPDTADPSAALDDVLATLGPGLIVLDQFERLLTCYTGADRRTFLDRLLAVGGHGGIRLLVVIRADFLGECADHPGLRAAVQDHQALVGPLGSEKLRSAVERQALAGGVRLEAGLAARMFDQVGDEPAAMSLVQLTLLELWRRRHGPWLRNKEFDALGGVQKVVALAAETAFGRLSADDRMRARNLFLRLVRVDAMDPRRDTRERVFLRALVPGGESLTQTRELVRRLSTEAPLLTVGDGENPPVEIVHDTLLRNWPRLRDEWVDKNRRDLRLRAALADAAGEWAQGGGKPGEPSRLWWGARLSEAEQLRDAGLIALTQVELDFIAASVRRRKRRSWYAGLAVAAVVGLVPFASVREYVNVRTRLAQEQKDLRFANARRLAALSLLAGERPGKLSLLLAVEAANATRADGTVLPEADAALLRAIGDLGGYPLTLPRFEQAGALAAAPNGTGLFVSTYRAPVGGFGSAPDTSEAASQVYEVGIDDRLDFGTPVRLFLVPDAFGHPGPFKSLGVSPSGRWLVAEAVMQASLYDLKARGPGPVRLPIIPKESGRVYHGRRIWITEDDRWAVWRAPSIVPMIRLRLLTEGQQDELPPATVVTGITDDGRWLMVERGGRFTAYDLAADTPSGTGKPLPPTTRHVTTAGRRIGVIDTDGRFGFFDPSRADQGLAEQVAIDPRKCTGATFLSPDARWLITLGEEAWWLWRLATRGAGPPIRLAKESSWLAVHFSPGGDWAAVHTGGELHLVSLRPDQPEPQVYRLPREFQETGGFRAFSPDGRWLVTAEADDRRITLVKTDKPPEGARLWDLSRPGAAGADVPLRGEGPCNAAVFDPGGRWLVTDGKRRPRLYPLRTEGRLVVARRLCDRNLTRAEWDEFFPGVEYRKTFDDLPGPADGP
jgi:hypothetical protein